MRKINIFEFLNPFSLFSMTTRTQKPSVFSVYPDTHNYGLEP